MSKKKKAKKQINKQVTCPKCRQPIKRSIESMKKHYSENYNRILTDAEAFKFATTKGSKKRPFGSTKNFKEVSGGAYGLGRSRKH